MLANYHTHTPFCHHANGKPEEYAQNAVDNGLDILGFSDHVPYPFPVGYNSGFRIDMHETENYYLTVNSVKEKFRDKIKIYTGYETEFYPAHFEDMLKNIDRLGYDYLILGQHYLNNEYDGDWSGAPADEYDFKQYITQLINAIKTGVFSYIAHPDLINYRDDSLIFQREIDRLLDACIINDIPLEFNLLGFRDNRHYPFSDFWEAVGKSKCKVIIGWDAHTPKHTGDREIYLKAINELKKYNITPIEKLNFKKG